MEMERIEMYDNYRLYLRDYFADRKRRFPFFSNRYFCNKAGIKSPSLYQEVVDGKRNLTKNTLPAFIKGLGLTDKDASYFSALVHLNQSKTQHEKQLYFSQLKQLRRKIDLKIIPTDHYEYYSQWYNPVLRELACTIDWKGDYQLLARSVEPAIKKSQAKESIDLLLRLGLIRCDEKGCYHQSDPAISTGDHIKSQGVRNLNRQFSELGTRALEAFPPTSRYISSMTLGVSDESYRKIVQEVEEFKDRIRRIVDDDTESDKIYNCNIQLFPLSKDPKDTPDD
ncbi:MAG: TIGR02147 family protein [Chitinivibrionales bacterium]